MNTPADLSFLAPAGQVADWRMVVLFDALAGAGALTALPGTAADVAGRLGLDAHALRVALDALSAWGVVVREDDRYGLDADAPGSASVRHHARAVRSWSSSLDKRLRGEPAEAHPGGVLDPELFIDALGATARRTAPGIVDVVLARFPDARTVLDLGGGHGEYSLEFARRGLKVTLQDLPQMVEVVARRGTLGAAGVELFAGNFFETVPDGPFDIGFCAGITHTFDGEHNRTLYRRLRPILTEAGGIAIVTFLRHRHPLADVFAVQMLANANGGDSHGEDEYRAWLSETGFQADPAVIDLEGRPQSVLFAI